jgi:DnaJ family protein C protein 17
MQDDSFVDYYSLLGIPLSSTARQIAKAYRLKSLIYHPDKSTGSTELFHTLKLAFDTLKDPSLRSPYDDTYRARLERKIRNDEMDARRKAGRENLEAREEAVKRGHPVAPGLLRFPFLHSFFKQSSFTQLHPVLSPSAR